MNRPVLTVLAISAGVAACGGGDGGGNGDGSARVFALGTDFATAGIASTIDIPSLDVATNAIDGVASTDPVLRRFGDSLYVVNRLGADNVTIVDAGSLQLIDQISTGNGSNPQDAAVSGDHIYVAALAAPGVLILDAAQPDAGVTGMIDLSDLDPDDGIPNCSSLTIAGGRLYVTCQILDDEDAFLTPRGAGKLAVVDLADDSLVTTIDMQHANPLGFVYPSDALGGDLVVATVPSFADLSEGCVERISVSDTPTISCLVTNEELGGYASSVAETDDGELVFAVTEAFDDTDFGPIGFVITYDTAAGSLSSSPMTPTAQRPFDVAVCPTGHIALADAGGGIRIYEGGDELTTEPLDIGLPPVARGLTCY